MSANQQNSNNQIAGSITYPVRSQDNAEPLPQQPRQPRDLQGLLRFAMEATKAEDAPGNSEFTPMDEERRNFLEEALKGLTTNLAEVITNAIKVLTDSEKIRSVQLGQDLPEDIEGAFTSLLDVVDDMDVANDFHKLGGFAIFPICLSSENETIRSLSCKVLGECCQNNPYCQARALECGLVNVLISLVETDSGAALASAVYALSCACRTYPPACTELISQGGCSALAGLLAASEAPVRTKAAFLIKCLCAQYPQAKEKFIDMNIVKIITELIKSGRQDTTTEQYLSILYELVQHKDNAVIRQCLKPDVNVKGTLEDYLKLEKLKDDTFVEEKELCEFIIKVLNECPMECNEDVDR